MAERRVRDCTPTSGFERRGRLRRPSGEDVIRPSIPGHRNAQIVHDLRQPAAAISALASAIQARGGVNDDVRTALATIAKEANLLSAMCGRLLEEVTELQPLRLDALVEQVVERVGAVYSGEVISSVEPCVILGDELGWWRLLGNVIDNATRAAGARGTVSVALRLVEAAIELDVEDTGPGFGNVQTNFGLGLPTVFRVIDSYRGHVELGRSRLGGALVRMVVPALQPATVSDRA
jgi:signal transduction histidine kinase